MVRWEKALYAHFASRKAFVPPHLLLAQDWDIYDGSWSANADCVALNQVMLSAWLMTDRQTPSLTRLPFKARFFVNVVVLFSAIAVVNPGAGDARRGGICA